MNAAKGSKRQLASINILTMRTYFIQLLISSAVWGHFFMQGLCLGSPTVIIPQLRREANSTAAVSQGMVSWFSSSYNYSGMVLVLVLAFLPRYLGRKNCFIIVSTLAMCGFVYFYLSKTITDLMISAIILGVISANNITISVMILTEYSSPQYRGVFLTTKSASFLWGVWVANTIGTFFHWKYIPVVGCITIGYTLITVAFWPESPLWLANKGRLEECTKAHRWLKGVSPSSEKELNQFLNYCSNYQELNVEKRNAIYFWKECVEVISKDSFYKPLMISVLLTFLFNSLGKMTCTVYALDILKKVTNSESAAYKGLLILDGVTIIGAYIGCGVSKLVRRRSFIILTSVVGITFLYLLSFYMFLVKYNVLEDNMYISFALLSMYALVLSSGPVIMTSPLVSEFIPVSHRNAFTVVIGVIRNFLFATYLKLAPLLFTTVGFPGSFLFYATMSTTFLFLIYIFLPETKDKTLLEIENLIAEKK